MAIDPFTRHVQQNDERERVGCVTMQAADNAAQRPLPLRYPLDGRIRAVDAGVQTGVDVGTCRGDDPEQIERHRAQMPPRVRARAECGIEAELDPMQRGLQRMPRRWGVDCYRAHREPVASRETRTRPWRRRNR